MKKNLIFLPGMMCDGRIFSCQIEKFKDILNIEVANLSGANSLSGMAQSILKRTSFRRFYCCGLSLGGIMAMELMKQAEDRLDGIILLDTNHLADTSKKKIIRNEQIDQAKKGFFLKIIKEEMKPFYLENNESEKAKVFQKLFLEMAQDLGKTVFIEQSESLRDRESYEPILAKWQKPTLIVCGSEDKLCPPERHKLMRNIIVSGGGKVEFHIIKKASHIVNLEKPNELNRIIRQWISNN